MFRATYLGWQGWLFASGNTTLLADPLLVDEIGRGPRRTRLNFHFWPPRQLQLERMAPVRAVWISHEHEDHFNIPTLARLDRRIPLLLSSRMSSAARAIAHEMGFAVRLVDPGETVVLDDLILATISPDQTEQYDTDEWDTVAYVVRDADGHGAFFTNVDVPVLPAMAEAVSQMAERAGQPETLSFEAMQLGLWRHDSRHPTAAREMHHTGTAGASATTWRHGAEALAALRAGQPIRLLPGQTACFEAARLVALDRSAPFLTTAPEPWPERPSFWPRAGTDIEPPLCGERELPADAEPELEQCLAELAAFLYGGLLFRRFYSLSSELLRGRKATFALLLLSGDSDTLAYEYEPQSCSFVALTDVEDLSKRYVGTVMLWATDLVALFRGEMEPRTIVGSAREYWDPDACPAASFQVGALWGFFHPLRIPQKALAQYRRTAADEAATPCAVRADERCQPPQTQPRGRT
jgi:hypothetical protein